MISLHTWHDITIYRHISCDITHTASTKKTLGKCKFNENPPPRCGLLFLFFSAMSLPSSWLVFRLWHFLSFCFPPAGHITASQDRPYHQQTATLSLRDSRSACYLKACTFVFVSFFIFTPEYHFLVFLSLSLDTWYLVFLIPWYIPW